MQSYGLKTQTIFRSKNRFFHYEPLSASSFRKNLSTSGAIHFQKAKFLQYFLFRDFACPVGLKDRTGVLSSFRDCFKIYAKIKEQTEWILFLKACAV